MPKVLLTTDLTKSECLARLRKVAGPHSARGWFDLTFPAVNGPIFVWVRGDRVKIAKATGGPQRNSFRRLFDGKVIEHQPGALIEGQFRMHRFVALFMAVWFGAYVYAIALITVSIGSRAIGHAIGPQLNVTGPILLVVPVLMLLGFVLVRSGIQMARGGEDEVLHFLQRTLSASIMTNGSGQTSS